MSSSVEARCLVIDFVNDLANTEPDPADWTPHLILLLKRLKAEAYELNRPEALQAVFAELHSELGNRAQVSA